VTPAKAAAGAVQKAMFARASTDPVLAGLGVAVVDDTSKAVKPYIAIGDGEEAPDNAHGEFGRTVTEVLDIWSEQRGWAEAEAILSRLCELFDHQPLPLEGHRAVSCRFTHAARIRSATEPYDRHIAARFTVTTAQTTE
jgi:hypothetical protein